VEKIETERDRERDRERQRETERDRERQRETERDREERQRETERYRESQKETERECVGGGIWRKSERKNKEVHICMSYTNYKITYNHSGHIESQGDIKYDYSTQRTY
jgi:hypothetical protein